MERPSNLPAVENLATDRPTDRPNVPPRVRRRSRVVAWDASARDEHVER